MQYEDMKFSLKKMVYIYYIITETKSIICTNHLYCKNILIVTLRPIVKDISSFELY